MRCYILALCDIVLVRWRERRLTRKTHGMTSAIESDLDRDEYERPEPAGRPVTEDELARQLAEDYALARGEWASWEDLPEGYKQRWRAIAREKLDAETT